MAVLSRPFHSGRPVLKGVCINRLNKLAKVGGGCRNRETDGQRRIPSERVKLRGPSDRLASDGLDLNPSK